MCSFGNLIAAAERTGEDEDVSAILSPVALRAEGRDAEGIVGLSGVLSSNGWTGSEFSGAVDLPQLRRDLWKLYGLPREARFVASLCPDKRLAVAAPDNPIEAITDVLDVLSSIGVLMPPGQLLTKLSNSVHCSLIEIGKRGACGFDQAQALRGILRRHGWSNSRYFFDKFPDTRALRGELLSRL